MFDEKVNFITHTAGDGYWSKVSQCVRINRVKLFVIEDQFGGWGELRAYFDVKDWNVENDGLIYTDDIWMRSFRTCMETLGFSDEALQDIHYSEQGMQGDNYVSMDVTETFIRECEAVYRFVVNQKAVNI